MGVAIIRGTTQKPGASQRLIQVVATRPDWSGKLFIGYPIVATPEGPHQIDALLVSESRGLIVFDLIEGPDIRGFKSRQDDTANRLDAKLRTYPTLTKRRDLRIAIHSLSFAPAATNLLLRPDDHDGYSIANADTLAQTIDDLEWHDRNEHVYATALSALENITTIRRSHSKRSDSPADSRAGILRRLEQSVATLDTMQSRAVIETVDGIQRIRGLAGSGKTIVLALKAAYLHSQHPHWRIAVTFNTRSLKGYFRRLIEEFCIGQVGEAPDWDNLRVINAWGASGGANRDGLYHEFCRVHGLRYYDFLSARDAFGRGEEFAGACTAALQADITEERPYDAILVDEAQDLPPAFLKLCFTLLTDNHRLVYAYDELQNLLHDPLPSPDAIFGPGRHWNGHDPSRDIILEKCYRHSRPVLTTAHALGFGIFRPPHNGLSTGLVQMFDDAKLWNEVGYRVAHGQLIAGSEVTLQRTSDTSPEFLETHSSPDDLIAFRSFGDVAEQSQWLVDEIRVNIENDQLRPEDIIVINPNPITTRKQLGPIRRRLLDMGIQAHLAGVDTFRDVFFQEGSVTFTGIHRAKGNEVAMVYIVNAHDCWESRFNLAKLRNSLFAAITRSKAWVRVCGIGKGMTGLMQEYRALKENDYRLRFRYPTAPELRHLRIVHRDVTPAQGEKVSGYENNLSKLINDLEGGNVYIEDIDPRFLLDSNTLWTIEKRVRVMPTPNAMMRRINEIIRYLVEEGLADDQRFAYCRPLGRGMEEVTFSGSSGISSALKRRAYIDIYDKLRDDGAYNARMADGALVQMMYWLEDRVVRKHRLAFFPDVGLEEFQRVPEVYVEDETFGDVVQRRTVSFPFRFDYDAKDDVHRAVVHPKCHLTLGQYPECRIPVTAPVTPRVFMDFVLRNFYDTPEEQYADGLPRDGMALEESIDAKERTVAHVVVPYATAKH